jgi:hypothetical protein
VLPFAEDQCFVKITLHLDGEAIHLLGVLGVSKRRWQTFSFTVVRVEKAVEDVVLYVEDREISGIGHRTSSISIMPPPVEMAAISRWLPSPPSPHSVSLYVLGCRAS